MPDNHQTLRTTGITVIAFVAATFALYFGSELLVPLAFAFLLNGMLRPVVRWLENLRMPTTVAAGLVVLALIALLAAIGYGLSWPIENWMREIPQRFEAAHSKLEQIRKPIEDVTKAVQKIGDAARGSTTAPTTNQISTAGTSAAQPSSIAPPVTEAGSPPVPPLIARVLGTTTTILAALVEVLLMLYLLLAAGDLFVQKLVKSVAGVRDKKVAVQVVRDVEQAVLRYMLVTAVINVGQGVAVGLLMWWIGFPNPLLWGLFTFVLEFIPYLGGTIMVALLSVVAFATFEDIGRILAAPACYLLVTTIQNNIVSPIAYGRRFKLNPVAVLIAVLFWWFIWGIGGAFLAVPIIAAVKILCDRTQSCTALGEFLGD